MRIQCGWFDLNIVGNVARLTEMNLDSNQKKT